MICSNIINPRSSIFRLGQHIHDGHCIPSNSGWQPFHCLHPSGQQIVVAWNLSIIAFSYPKNAYSCFRFFPGRNIASGRSLALLIIVSVHRSAVTRISEHQKMSLVLFWPNFPKFPQFFWNVGNFPKFGNFQKNEKKRESSPTSSYLRTIKSVLCDFQK